MTEQEISYEEPHFFSLSLRDNPSYATVQREELQPGKGMKKQRCISDRWVSISALVVAISSLVVAVGFAAIWKSDCSCNEGVASQVTVQVHSTFHAPLAKYRNNKLGLST